LRKRTSIGAVVSLATGAFVGWLTAAELLDFAHPAIAATTSDAVGQVTSQQPKSSGKKPIIVFMMVDNFGYGDLGCYGGGTLRGVPTPRLDKLAAEGMRLTNFNVEPVYQ
jgi:Sulfatase